MPDVLGRLIAATRRRLAERRERLPEEALERAAREARPAGPTLREALHGRPGVQVIAEIKRASPSRGPIRPDLDAGRWARLYRRAGAAAISVLTEQDHFQGSLADLAEARVGGLPLLRKDFIVSRYQLLEARLHGAAGVLLLARALEAEALRRLHDQAVELGVSPLVEVHDDADLERVERVFPDEPPAIIGVNQRNLRTLEKDPGLFARLAERLPAGAPRVAESGISRPEEVRHVGALGYDAVLVGSSIAAAPEPEAQLRALVRAGRGSAGRELQATGPPSAASPSLCCNGPAWHRRRARPLIKICGLTRGEDVRAAVDVGADLLGFVLWPKSPRAVTVEEARALIAAVPARVDTVGVFVDQPAEEVADIARALGLRFVQLHGDEPPEALAEVGVPAIKAFRVGEGFDPARLDAWGDAAALLLDAHVPGVAGGTGREIPDARLDGLLPVLGESRVPWMLAGGLTAENVGRRLHRLHPWAVDVSSGVEEMPGVKDAGRMRAFVAAVRREERER